jgi:hypothetical protein
LLDLRHFHAGFGGKLLGNAFSGRQRHWIAADIELVRNRCLRDFYALAEWL